MSGHVGLREDARLGRNLALKIAALFPLPRCRSQGAGATRGSLQAGCARPTAFR